MIIKEKQPYKLFSKMKILYIVIIIVSSTFAGNTTISITDLNLTIDTLYWSPMSNESPNALNFLENKCDTNTFKFCRVVTIYKTPMSIENKTGIQISSNEFIDIMIVNPGYLTVQIKVDKGNYWIMSRETYKNPNSLDLLKSYDAFPRLEKQQQLLIEFKKVIDETFLMLKKGI